MQVKHSERQSGPPLGSRTANRPAARWLPRLVVGTTLALGLGSGCVGDIGEPAGPIGSVPQASCAYSADPIRRLTPNEYRNTVATLFSGVTLPPIEPLADSRIDGFVGHVDGQSISALGVSNYEQMSESIGMAAASALSGWAACSEDSSDCTQQIATELAARAYRRPLDSEERSALQTFAAESYTGYGFQEGVALVVEGILQSPFFLFRPELGATPNDAGLVPLDNWEMASRLSYFFLDNMPDDELWAAAEAGSLTSDAGIEAQARRLLTDERARPVLTHFLSEWLRVYKLDELALDPNLYPEATAQLQADLQESARLYLEKALWQDDSWESLFNGHYGYVNDRLAPLFGVEAPGSADELVLIDLPATERAGILTQPALLASTSHGIQHSPIFRGVTMLESILCNKIDAPPPGILDDFMGPDVPADEVCTVRDQIAKTHTVGNDCQSCHLMIDGAGFAFENYDALGRFRTEENGCTVDASGSFPGTLGDVDGAVDMASKLVDSRHASLCMASHLYRYGLGRSQAATDQCFVETLRDAMVNGGGSMQEMIVALVLSPAYRNRPAGNQ